MIYTGELGTLEQPIAGEPARRVGGGVLMSRGRPYEIAIVGMGCRFPGASDLSAYFENIVERQGLHARSAARPLGPSDVLRPGLAGQRPRPSCRGGYLDSPIPFDAAAHGIMPRTVEGGEPEQFLVLDATVAALADAGLALESLDGHASRS